MGTGSNPQNFQIGNAGGGYTGSYYGGTGNAGNLNFGQAPYNSGFVSNQSTFLPSNVPGTAGGPSAGWGFLDNLSFGQQYGIGAAADALAKGLTSFTKSKFEKQSFQWKAEMYRRNAMLKQRMIDDMKKVGKQKEAELLRKYKLLKRKAKPGGRKNTNILAGAGSALDILMGIDIVEAADMGVLRTNVQKDIYGAKVGKWSDDTSAAMYANRAAQSSPLGDMASTMLSSAASSGMKYWKYKNSLPSTSSWT